MSIAETKDPDALKIVFLPAKGHKVEFQSDRQTEKGPSGGHVTGVNYKAGTCTISHSDTGEPGEEFVMDGVRVLRRSRHHRTKEVLWILQ